MISLHPVTEVDHFCPYCRIPMEVRGWHIPGMRNLADLTCSRCRREYFGDLASGHGLYYPMLLEKATARVHDPASVPWFARWLRESFKTRSDEPLEFQVEERKPLRKGILLNCLDGLYGHSLLKLLNAQYYLDNKPDLDLIVLVPSFLRWLVPEGVAAIWNVKLPRANGTVWNEWLAGEIHRRVEQLEVCYLSVALAHPHPDSFQIERFSRVKPFDMSRWQRDLEKPKVTFIWREDRTWSIKPPTGIPPFVRRPLNRLSGTRKSSPAEPGEQTRRVIDLADRLRRRFSDADFAVAGLGQPGKLPGWMRDLRFTELTAKEEDLLCARYAASHVVIGVHGSNMLLPSAHAATVVELVPDTRWRNIVQDLLIAKEDQRETLLRYRLVPLNTTADEVAKIVGSILTDWSLMLGLMRSNASTHESVRDVWVRRSRHSS